MFMKRLVRCWMQEKCQMRKGREDLPERSSASAARIFLGESRLQILISWSTEYWIMNRKKNHESDGKTGSKSLSSLLGICSRCGTHIFEGRLYIYGSHDRFNGYAYCQNDYVCWSASPEDLSDWRYEGVIYSRKADPRNEDGDGCLYAPDVARGPDGRYYLFYVLDNQPVISVAVCSSPAGTYEFYGYVRDKDGGILGERPGDEGQFDPAVLVDDDQIWLYSGYCGMYHPQRKGPMVMALEPDMLTLKTEPKTLIPSAPWSQGTGFENHAFF